ncbi:MAG: ABC transporter transmembrane domain-containing protein, partial [Xenococcaceae cyanobacterium MO_188.B29]|nr:ABC transporter transmembrane domain-containing protein [Xenococcaceae cyanobacterium MO_188.B29]
MTLLTHPLEEFIAEVSPFNQLPPEALAKLSAKWQPVRYRLGETILIRDKIPAHITVICSGQARLLGYDPRSQKEVTITKLEPGAILGWASLIREVYTETAIASSELDCLVLPTQEFYALLKEYPDLANEFQQKCALIEVFELLGAELERRADGATDLKEIAQEAYAEAVVCQVPPTNPEELDSDFLWFVSGGSSYPNLEGQSPFEFSPSLPNLPVGTLIDTKEHLSWLNQISSGSMRLIGIPKSIFVSEIVKVTSNPEAIIPYARDYLTPPESLPSVEPRKNKKTTYPFVRGKGDEKATMACFEMLGEYFRVPFHREVIRTVVVNQQKRGNLSLPFCAAVADLMGLQTQIVGVAANNLPKLPTPALVRWEDNFAILYEISQKRIVLATPESGIKNLQLATFVDIWGESGQVLLLKEGATTPKNKFGISWFIPALSRYRRVLLEVLIASFFVQLFGLVNPLMTQVIIDQVIGGNSLDTLHVLGVLLIFVAIFEGFLGCVRTYLFTDTTNRIDLTLASQVIDHLLRLPMSYFGKRPVGELTTRVTELEKIRSFLTGTALTLVLDAIFSVIYVVVMVIYSPLLTLVALLVIPLFILLTLIFSPILRRMLRTKAERYAATNSYLVEVLSGIETVKSQNIELRSRMTWQQQYGRYISAGFKAVKLSTIAGSLSDFLNKVSSLLVLWVGAYLVLNNKLTLGELIAFRIISGYVTGPLLRLSQLWQNFQETALSIER